MSLNDFEDEMIVGVNNNISTQSELETPKRVFKFVNLTRAQYDLLENYNSHYIYFLYDTKELMKGRDRFNDSFTMVDNLPTVNIHQGMIYFLNSTLEGYVYINNKWVSMIQPIIKESINDNDNTQKGVVTVDSLKEYIGNKLKSFVVDNSGINNLRYDEDGRKLIYTKASETREIPLNGLVKSVRTDGNSIIFGITGSNSPIVVDFPTDNYATSAYYDINTKSIVLTMRNGNEVRIPIMDMISHTLSINSNTLSIANYDGRLTGDVKVSKADNNAISVRSDGLYVQLPDQSQVTIGPNKGNEIVTTNADGSIKASGISIGSDSLQEDPKNNVLATEMAVNSAIDSLREELSKNQVPQVTIVNDLDLNNPSQDKAISEALLVKSLQWNVYNN